MDPRAPKETHDAPKGPNMTPGERLWPWKAVGATENQRLKNDQKIVYTSRFVRVILAQGPY